MLVLTRKLEEKIHIGDNITITVLEMHVNGKGRVRLGIEAPRDVKVFRGELLQRLAALKASPAGESAELEIEAPVLAAAAIANAPAEADASVGAGLSHGKTGPRTDPSIVDVRLSPAADVDNAQNVLRRRVPSVSVSAAMIRPPQRLGPTSLRTLAAAACRRK